MAGADVDVCCDVQLACPERLARLVQIPTRYASFCPSCSRAKKKKIKNPEPVDIARLPSDKHGNRCSYYYALHEPNRSWLSRLLGRSTAPVPLPTNCPPTGAGANKKEQVYWFGFERDEIDEMCGPPKKPPLSKCRKQQKLMAEQCGCLPPAQLCDPTRFHYPGMCIVRETYSAEPLVYRRCEPKPRKPPKPPLPPAVQCLRLACSFQRWLPVSEDAAASEGWKETLKEYAGPYDEFNYVQRQRQAERNADIMLNKYCSGNP